MTFKTAQSIGDKSHFNIEMAFFMYSIFEIILDKFIMILDLTYMPKTKFNYICGSLIHVIFTKVEFLIKS